MQTKLYGTTAIDDIANENNTCYEIVLAVRQHGINQRQLLKLIELFALELENIEYAQKISTLANELSGQSLVKGQEIIGTDGQENGNG